MSAVVEKAMTLAMGAVLMWTVTLGPQGMLRKVHEVQLANLRDVGRTSNWGDPSIWGHHSRRAPVTIARESRR